MLKLTTRNRNAFVSMAKNGHFAKDIYVSGITGCPNKAWVEFRCFRMDPKDARKLVKNVRALAAHYGGLVRVGWDYGKTQPLNAIVVF